MSLVNLPSTSPTGTPKASTQHGHSTTSLLRACRQRPRTGLQHLPRCRIQLRVRAETGLLRPPSSPGAGQESGTPLSPVCQMRRQVLGRQMLCRFGEQGEERLLRRPVSREMKGLLLPEPVMRPGTHSRVVFVVMGVASGPRPMLGTQRARLWAMTIKDMRRDIRKGGRPSTRSGRYRAGCQAVGRAPEGRHRSWSSPRHLGIRSREHFIDVTHPALDFDGRWHLSTLSGPGPPTSALRTCAEDLPGEGVFACSQLETHFLVPVIDHQCPWLAVACGADVVQAPLK
jgi:hypothetical protein